MIENPPVNNKLILFFDGTSNKFGDTNTNVLKAYRIISSNKSQLKCYIPGVGSLVDKNYNSIIKRHILKLSGLLFGTGLPERVIEGYNFIVKNYNIGDEIFMFGFSRGAYTAKVLAGLIHTCGLMAKHNEYLVQYAFHLYSQDTPNFDLLAKFKGTFSSHSPRIKFMGLWDSVSSVGELIQKNNLPYTSNMLNVDVVRHALAIDERRFDFMNNTSNSKSSDNIQMWFAGVHSDVGGGNSEKESELSKIPLIWMLDEGEKYGLSIDNNKLERYAYGKQGDGYVGPNPLGMMHKNHWLFILLNLIPRIITITYNPIRKKIVFPLFKRRIVDHSHKVHKSVLDRMKGDECYRPKNLQGYPCLKILE